MSYHYKIFHKIEFEYLLTDFTDWLNAQPSYFKIVMIEYIKPTESHKHKIAVVYEK